MSEKKMVEFTHESAKQFVKHYNEARRSGVVSFKFEGNEYLVTYAYYLIQYLEMNKLLAGGFNDEKIYSVKRA